MSFGNGVFDNNQPTPADLTLHGYEESTTQTYADNNNHTFELLSTPPDPSDPSKNQSVEGVCKYCIKELNRRNLSVTI